MKNIPVTKHPLHTTDVDRALKEKSPGELASEELNEMNRRTNFEPN